MTKQLPDGHELYMLAPLLTCESPIEEMMLEALVAQAAASGLTMVAHVGERVYPVTPRLSEQQVWLWCQPDIDRYRLDFAAHIVTPSGVASQVLAIECDGHDYHERTKKQAARDRRRDRDIQRLSAAVFRFTGSEIVNDASACAISCLEFLQESMA